MERRRVMQSEPVHIYQVTATFHPATESFTFLMEGRPLTDRTISVPQGIHIIVFTLETDPFTPPVGAEFTTFPVQWISETGTPIHAPQCFQIQWHDTQHFAIIDYNCVSAKTPYKFNILVSYEGKIHGSDPTI